MKFILSVVTLLIVYSFIDISKKQQPDKIVLLIDQVSTLWRIANTIETFWHDKPYFDTIQITGKFLVNEINQTISTLSLQKNVSEISYEACIIRYSKNKAIDTFYSWRWFDYWKNGTTMYFDSLKKLEGMFSNMYNQF